MKNIIMQPSLQWLLNNTKQPTGRKEFQHLGPHIIHSPRAKGSYRECVLHFEDGITECEPYTDSLLNQNLSSCSSV